MRADKRTRLEAAGWRVGSAGEFLELSEDEIAYVEMKLALARALRERRQKQGKSQTALAKLVGSSQSRIAKMEAGDPSVSIDLLVKSLLALGASRKELGKAVGGGVKAA